MTITLPGLQAVANHGALWAAFRQDAMQEHLNDTLGTWRWDVDLESSRLSFIATDDDRRRIDTRLHVIASLAPGPRSLLWGWAHPQTSGSPAVDRLREVGEQYGIDDLTSPEVPFGDAGPEDDVQADMANLAHVAGAAAVEVSGLPAYFSAGTGSSRLVMLVEGLDLPPADFTSDMARLGTSLFNCMTTDYAASLRGYARHGGFQLTTAPDGRTDELTDGRSRVTVTWDESGRPTNISGQLRGADA